MFMMYLFRNHATTSDGSGVAQPGKYYFDIDIFYDRVLIFPKTSLKLPSQHIYGHARKHKSFFRVGRRRRLEREIRLGDSFMFAHFRRAQHVAVYTLYTYTYTNECVSEPLMRTPTDGI